MRRAEVEGSIEIQSMASLELIRRAEIGRQKRARTRSQLIAALRARYSAGKLWNPITVDEVAHFDDLQGLTTAVAEDLVRSFDELLQSGPHC
jgi:hypothetical protein